MTWNQLCADGRAEPHYTSREEVRALRGAIRRDLADAALPNLSADNRFGLAYEAALLATRLAIACAGYRIKGPGHHQTTFEALSLAAGAVFSQRADDWNRARRKRNLLSYEHAGVVSDQEADELLSEARTFLDEIEKWMARRHPELAG